MLRSALHHKPSGSVAHPQRGLARAGRARASTRTTANTILLHGFLFETLLGSLFYSAFPSSKENHREYPCFLLFSLLFSDFQLPPYISSHRVTKNPFSPPFSLLRSKRQDSLFILYILYDKLLLLTTTKKNF